MNILAKVEEKIKHEHTFTPVDKDAMPEKDTLMKCECGVYMTMEDLVYYEMLKVEPREVIL